ncbi:MAG: LPS export ABC transporter periplasmic protein LptC [Tolumonas sp.]|jgi:lipopolysaccharide export system protein LptC|nr:MAG: LPS export ABC transporter periplasmic protein LptC [Tolumonas sp.]
MINRQTLLLLLLFIVSLLAWQWSTQHDEQNLQTQKKDLSLPSFTASSLHTYRYTIDGKLTDIFSADQTLYYQHNKVTEAVHPLLRTFETDGKEAWNISANSGKLLSQDRLLLKDNVLIKNKNPAINVDRMQTSYLEMDMNKNQISSDQPVSIDSPDYHVQGVGFHADLKTKRYQILDKGHATYFKPR